MRDTTTGRYPLVGHDRSPGHVDPVGALDTIGVVAEALNAHGPLEQLAATALGRMRASLGLQIAAMHLVDSGDDDATDPGPGVLVEFARDAEDGSVVRVRRELSPDALAWSLLAAARGPIVVGEAADWLIANPFDPPATSWLVLPLQSEGVIVGTVVGASAEPIVLDSAGAMVLTTLGNMLSTGIATGRMRMDRQRMAVHEERMHLLAELHDGLAQDLAVAKREIAIMGDLPSAAAANQSWARLRQAVEDAHQAVRSGLENLSVVVPLDGLHPAVEELCRRFGERGLAVSAELEDAAIAVPHQVSSTVLRVLHQCLTNVHQHAHVSRAHVSVHVRRGVLRLEVADAGPGPGRHRPRPDARNFGISIMTRRARAVGGTLAVSSGLEGGTVVTLDVPLQPLPRT